MNGDTESSSRHLERRLIHEGRRFAFETLIERRPDGRTVERDIVRHPGAVVIVPILDRELVMIRNERAAVGDTLLELPAGTLEPAEGPQVCAGRELVEETGYEAATVDPLGWFYTTPGLTDERMHAFVATGLRHVGQQLEEDERITVTTIPLDDRGTGDSVFELIDRAELRDAKSIVAILLAARRGCFERGG